METNDLQRLAYMGGIARNKIAKLHEDAKALIDAEAPSGS